MLNPSSGPAKIRQISQWNKPMNDARLSPDGHAVAFVSPVGGIAQVFLMLTSGAEPLQLTNDERDKSVDTFSRDGRRSITRGLSGARRFGPCLRSVGLPAAWHLPAT
jgi:Tol biopolymer transport system component